MTGHKVAKKKINSIEISQNSSLAQKQVVIADDTPVMPVKSKIERLEIKKLVPNKDQSLLMQVEPVVKIKNETELRLDKMEKNVI